MAKRRRLSAPDTQNVVRDAERLAAEQPPALSLAPTAPPIARVAQQTSDLAAAEILEARRSSAANEKDASLWRAAEAEGRVARSIALNRVETEHLSRDRMTLDDAEMAELKASIASHGLRMPVEVLELPSGDGEVRFGLISGWRRLQALRALWAETGDPRFGSVNALVRQPRDTASAYVAMVEENEIRADLSHYERGRVAVVAAGQGAFPSTEEAVNALFASASKAKRSKIRSFALLHEELGDLLRFGPALSERAGLRLAAAARSAGPALRDALAEVDASSAEQEWAVLEPVILDYEKEGARSETSTKRPKKSRPSTETRSLANGLRLDLSRSTSHLALRISGASVDPIVLDRLAEFAESILSAEVSHAKPAQVGRSRE